ncbi:Flp family type IVb pilin [Salidesulfovibrio onnuriiensis]|uniref:Flp family type IVb pilin n=1 Tax=Salidesulfovibrio onnuriiensis TaxID=2583823 RepID=UPI0011CCDBCB|nr:Flp family type IVb pilin [Salidesulfovibrio onnuriiensis]
MTKLMNLIRNEEGATALEYGLIAALIAAGIAGAVTALGDQVVATFDFISAQMQAAMTPSP